jgi:DNA polymerase IV
MTGSEQLFGKPESIGHRMKDAIREATGLAASVGLSATKYVAKVARSDPLMQGYVPGVGTKER